MSNVLTVTCGSCGAEESMDSVLMRMVDDDAVRQLVRDLLCSHYSVGGTVLRYLRLFKPAKHKLGMPKVRVVLAELVPDISRAYIERKGRTWQVGQPQWAAAFAAVFAAVDKGTLKTPLPSNAYLYEVLMRQADASEAQAETQAEQQRRVMPQRDHVQVRSQALSVADAFGAARPAKDPTLAALDKRDSQAAPMPEATRQRIQQLLNQKKGA